MNHTCSLESPVGRLILTEDGSGISGLSLDTAGACRTTGEMTPLLRAAATQLAEYFAGKRKTFALPLSLHGTPFQRADWNALLTIPYGETRSYLQIARQLDKPKACRAVGGANSRNPVMIIVPCHRVIAANGSLGGYACGLNAKRFLLELEKRCR